MATGIGQYGFGAKMLRYAEAGNYYSASNATPGTGIVTGVVTTLADTTPYIVFKNNNPVGSAIRCYLDMLVLNVTVVGATFSGSRQACHKIDSSQAVARYTSGAGAVHGAGQAQSISNVNADSSAASAALVYVGAITAAAAGAARIIASHTLRSAIEVVFDTYTFDFGAAQQQPKGGLIDNSTTVAHNYFGVPPIVIGPQEHYLLHIWGATIATGITFGYNLGWIEA